MGDNSDICPGGDDLIDIDEDGIPDYCDLLVDSDGDGIMMMLSMHFPMMITQNGSILMETG